MIKRLQEIEKIEQYNNFFLFKTNNELAKNFFSNWTKIDGTQSNFN